jgi:hypothetical protein
MAPVESKGVAVPTGGTTRCMGSQAWWVVTRKYCIPLLPGPGDADKPSPTRARSTPGVHRGQQGWGALASHRKEDGVALAYCSAHERLLVVAQGGWMPFAEDEVYQIEYLYALLGFANLEVIETACDHCAQGGRTRAKPSKRLSMIN